MTPSSSPKPNKRFAPRLPPKGSTRARCYRGPLGLGPNLALSVLDVSETGIRVILSNEVRQGQEIEINLENVAHRPVKVLAEVIWAMPTPDGHFCVGARFQRHLAYADLRALTRS